MSAAQAPPPAPLEPIASLRRGFFRRGHEPSTGGPLLADAVYATVPGNGIEPVVQMGTLEALLTARSYDEVMAPHPGGQTIAVRDGGERLVMKLTGTLSSALAAASDDRLAQVAVPWSQTDEFWGQGEPEALAGFLLGLAGLVREARQADQYLYCWVCV